jgi:hypothetical protein
MDISRFCDSYGQEWGIALFSDLSHYIGSSQLRGETKEEEENGSIRYFSLSFDSKVASFFLFFLSHIITDTKIICNPLAFVWDGYLLRSRFHLLSVRQQRFYMVDWCFTSMRTMSAQRENKEVRLFYVDSCAASQLLRSLIWHHHLGFQPHSTRKTLINPTSNFNTWPINPQKKKNKKTLES